MCDPIPVCSRGRTLEGHRAILEQANGIGFTSRFFHEVDLILSRVVSFPNDHWDTRSPWFCHPKKVLDSGETGGSHSDTHIQSHGHAHVSTPLRLRGRGKTNALELDSR